MCQFHFDINILLLFRCHSEDAITESITLAEALQPQTSGSHPQEHNLNEQAPSTEPSVDGASITSPSNGDGHVEAHEISPEPRKTRVVEIHRTKVRDDMIRIYSNPSIIKDNIEMIVINQKGEKEKGKGSGILQDMYSMFWRDAYESLMLGEGECVPCIRHDYQREEWEVIGRILLMGYQTCQYFPLRLSKAFIVHCFFGESFLTREMLMQSFRQYVSECEQEIIDSCLAGKMEPSSDALIDFLSNFDCKTLVKKENLVQILEEIAHKELIQRPQYVANCWKVVLPDIKCCFPSISMLGQLYERLLPTNAKAVASIHAEPCTEAERESLKHLKRFIKGLDATKLASFLRFVSGSDNVI